MTDTHDDAALRALAEKASAGGWCVDDHIVHPGDTPYQWHVYETYEDDPPLATCPLEADARYIAAAHPQAILTLLDTLADLRARLAAAEDALTKAQAVARDEVIAYLEDQLAAMTAERDELKAALEQFAEARELLVLIHRNSDRLKPENGDWACAECKPHSDILVPGFQCAYHTLLAWHRRQPIALPTTAPRRTEEA